MLVCFISNLDETTRSVYKENVRLNAALDFHLKEGQELKKVCLFSVAKMFKLLNNSPINARAQIGQLAMVYCAGKLIHGKIAPLLMTELLYKSYRPQVSMV